MTTMEATFEIAPATLTSLHGNTKEFAFTHVKVSIYQQLHTFMKAAI